MRTIFVLGLAFMAAVFTIPTTADAAINPGTCTVINRNLTVGSTGTDVSNLQRYLVAQNYPGGGNWMVTGYFGEATRVAVRNFQISAGLSQTGYVDANTRSAIQQYSCGGSSYYNPYGSSYSYTDPYYGSGVVLGASTGSNYNPYTGSYTYTNTNTNYCTYYNCQNQSISISYISPNTGASGTRVSVYGSGFSEENNTVHIGSGIVPFVRSSNNGTVLAFTVPDTLLGYGSQPIQNRTYDLYVTNAFGQNSNQVNFTVGGSAGTGNQPFISNITGPNTVTANQNNSWNVTVYGPADSIVKVDVIWGDEYQQNASGSDQQSIFVGNNGTASLSFSHTYKVNGTYSPTFIASNGYGSNSRTQSVVVGTGGNVGSVSLNSLSPNSGQRGSQVILFGSGFTTSDNVVHFGFGGLRNVTSLSNGTALYFTVPHYISPCDTVVGSCNTTPTAVTTGTYPVYVTNSNGTTQTLNFTVTN